MRQIIEFLFGMMIGAFAIVFFIGLAELVAPHSPPGVDALDEPQPLSEAEFKKLQEDLRKSDEEKGPAVPIPDPGPNVLVSDFYADWCGPCRAAQPKIDQLQREGYAIARYDVDTDYGKGWQRVYHVTSIPTFIVHVDGVVALRTGNVDELAKKLHALKPPRP